MLRRFHVCHDGDPIPAVLQGAIVAIGNFDGVHRGHQALIAAAGETAAGVDRPSAVLTFEPHPRQFFKPEAPLFRLTPEPVKIDVLRRHGVDGVFVRRFDAALATLTAESFVARFLVGSIRAAGVVVGHDFHFGQGREGTPGRLRDLCRDHQLSCAIVPVVTEEGQAVSSSAIRAALEAGDVARANACLGYRWFIRGQVRHGEKRGRVLGFPTANLRLPDDNRLRHGIYAVRVRAGDRVFGGVAGHGRRPTFDNGAPLLEVHLFDFAGDLYGTSLDVEFAGWIRGEERFEGADALVARMNVDAAEARDLLARDRTRSLIA